MVNECCFFGPYPSRWGLYAYCLQLFILLVRLIGWQQVALNTFNSKLLSQRLSNECCIWLAVNASVSQLFVLRVFGATMGDKSIETLGNKIRFWNILDIFPPPTPRQCWCFSFFNCTDHRIYTTLNLMAGSIRELTLARYNEIEQMPKVSKSVFSKKCLNFFCRSFQIPILE